MTDPYTGKCYFLIGPKTLFSVFILERKGPCLRIAFSLAMQAATSTLLPFI